MRFVQCNNFSGNPKMYPNYDPSTLFWPANGAASETLKSLGAAAMQAQSRMTKHGIATAQQFFATGSQAIAEFKDVRDPAMFVAKSGEYAQTFTRQVTEATRQTISLQAEMAGEVMNALRSTTAAKPQAAPTAPARKARPAPATPAPAVAEKTPAAPARTVRTGPKKKAAPVKAASRPAPAKRTAAAGKKAPQAGKTEG